MTPKPPRELWAMIDLHGQPWEVTTDPGGFYHLEGFRGRTAHRYVPADVVDRLRAAAERALAFFLGDPETEAYDGDEVIAELRAAMAELDPPRQSK